MPGYILHLGATVMCNHGGQALPAVTNLRVLVNGQPIVNQPTQYAITGCSYSPTAGNGPCANASWLTAATRVKSNGTPVLLQDSVATCSPTGTGLMITVIQTRVTGI